METNGKTLQIVPIGSVARGADGFRVNIDAPYRIGLKDLGGFSHVIVFWWAERWDDAEHRQAFVTPLPYAEGHEAGVFACRAPVRPNLIMTTVCRILGVDEAGGVVRLANIDAFDGTPVIDLKPYYGITDRVQNPRIPDYLVGWPEWMPEEGIGLMPGEE